MSQKEFVDDYEELYLKGKIYECEKVINILTKQCIGVGPELITESICSNLNAESELSLLILESNHLVVKCLVKMEIDDDCQTFIQPFYCYFEKVKGCSVLEEVSPVLILNTSHNLLWLHAICHQSNIDDSEKDNLYQIIIDIYKKVLQICKERPQVTSNLDKEKIILQYMNQAICSNFNCEVICSFQIIEICLLTLKILLNFNTKYGNQCKLIALNLKDLWTQLKEKVYNQSVGNLKWRKKGCKLFKFGLSQLNDIVANEYEHMFKLINIFGILYCIHCDSYKESLQFDDVKINEMRDSNNFMWYYLKAYTFYKINMQNICQSYLANLEKFPLNNMQKTYFHILKGQHFSSKGCYVAAHQEFLKAVKINHCDLSSLYSIIDNLKILLHSFCTDYSDTKGLYNLLYSSLKALCLIYQGLNISDPKRTCDKLNFENTLVLSVNKHKKISKPDVLYHIGKELMWIEYVCGVTSELNPKACVIAVDCFLEIVSSENFCCTLDKHYNSILPSTRTVFHEAVTALILNGKLDTAEIMCELPIMYQPFFKEEGLSLSDDEQNLILLEQDLVALLLSIYIKLLKHENKQAMEYLKRCKTAILHFYIQKKPKEYSSSEKQITLIDALTARVYLFVALLHSQNGFYHDAKHSFERALVHNPGDPFLQEEVSKFIKTSELVIEIPDFSLHKQIVMEQSSSLALQYILSVKIPT